MSTSAKHRRTRLKLAPQRRRQRLPRREQAAQRGAHVGQVRGQRDAGRCVACPAVHVRRAALAQQRRERNREELARVHRVCCALRSGAGRVSGGGAQVSGRRLLLRPRAGCRRSGARHADQGMLAARLMRERATS